jgi:hypothetical protein
MTRQIESTELDAVVQLLADHGFDGMAQAIETLMNEAMKLQRSEALGALPYQRTADRRGHANGFKPKTVASRLGKLELQVPQTRGVEFYPTVLERGERSERALKLAVAEMYVQGVSTRKVAAITQELCGLEVNSTQVSRAAALLDEELSAWRNRPLGETPYLILDARYEKIRHAGAVVSSAVLIAIGVTSDGARSILGVSVSLSEAEVHWREFLASLKTAGCTACDTSSATITRVSSRPARPASPTCRGNAASSTWLRMRCTTFPASPCGARSPATSAASSTPATGPRPIGDSFRSSRSMPRRRPNWPPGWKPTCLSRSPC